MDLKVYPDSHIARLPRAARMPALVIRNVISAVRNVADSLIVRPLHGFDYISDGMATSHYSPFLNDAQFNAAYDRMATWWLHGRPLDVRWRMWFLVQCAAQCRTLPGSFVEFGVYRAGCAFMILTLSGLGEAERFFLIDTFKGVPTTHLTPAERRANFAGRKAETTVDHVRNVLSTWHDRIVVVEGDIFDTLSETETGEIAFCHLDLNASAPTLRALEYVYPRLLPSAMIVIDDYGQRAYVEQRLLVDAFFADKPEMPLALPTGQGLIVRTG
jgi:hypothetical protein